MTWQQDIGAENLKAILRHTLYCTASFLAFMWVGWLAKIGLDPTSWLATVIPGTESFTFAVIFLMFTVHTLWELCRGLVKNVKSISIVIC